MLLPAFRLLRPIPPLCYNNGGPRAATLFLHLILHFQEVTP